jgi:hypothetical protein
LPTHTRPTPFAAAILMITWWVDRSSTQASEEG